MKRVSIWTCIKIVPGMNRHEPMHCYVHLNMHSCKCLDFAMQQIPDHLSSCDLDCAVQRVEVKRAEKRVRKAKGQHGWNPALGQLQRPAAFMHLVLPYNTSLHKVDRALGVHIHDKRMCIRNPLLTLQDVEVIICRVSACVSLRTHGRAEDNEVFGYGRVDEVHGPHGTTGIIEEPFVFERTDLVRAIPGGVLGVMWVVSEGRDGNVVCAVRFP